MLEHLADNALSSGNVTREANHILVRPTTHGIPSHPRWRMTVQNESDEMIASLYRVSVYPVKRQR
jgi:hypothetical protein